MYSGMSSLVILLLMQFGMMGSPLLPTNIAELEQTTTGHMVAPFIPLYYHLASPALSVMQIILKITKLIFLTIALMFSQVALSTILLVTGIADEVLVLW